LALLAGVVISPSSPKGSPTGPEVTGGITRPVGGGDDTGTPRGRAIRRSAERHAGSAPTW
jgi:hypothetical protein